MANAKNKLQKLMSVLLVCMMLLNLLPLYAFAAEGDGVDQTGDAVAQVIDAVTAALAKPTAGDNGTTITLTVSEGSPYTVSCTTVTESGSGLGVGEENPFKAGGSYVFAITVAAGEGYCFGESTTYAIDGTALTPMEGSNSSTVNLKYTYSLPAADAALDEDGTPEDNTTGDPAETAEDKKYEVTLTVGDVLTIEDLQGLTGLSLAGLEPQITGGSYSAEGYTAPDEAGEAALVYTIPAVDENGDGVEDITSYTVTVAVTIGQAAPVLRTSSPLRSSSPSIVQRQVSSNSYLPGAFSNLEAALDEQNWPDGAELRITLQGDIIEPGSPTIPAGRTLTLDLKGHTLTMGNLDANLVNNGTLTFLGNSAGPGGTLSGMLKNRGTLTIEGGQVTTLENHGEATLNGGNVTKLYHTDPDSQLTFGEAFTGSIEELVLLQDLNWPGISDVQKLTHLNADQDKNEYGDNINNDYTGKYPDHPGVLVNGKLLKVNMAANQSDPDEHMTFGSLNPVLAAGLVTDPDGDEQVTKYYDAADLSTALSNENKLRLLNNVNLNGSFTIPDDNDLTLDLNGKTFGASLQNQGSLTLENNSSVGGVLRGTLTNSGTLNVTGGIFNEDVSEFVDPRSGVVAKLNEKYAVNNSIDELPGLDADDALLIIVHVPQRGADLKFENLHDNLRIKNETETTIYINNHIIAAGTEGKLSEFPVRRSGSGYDYYTITATVEGNGSVSPSGRIVLREDGTRTYTFTPDEGYAVSDVKVDGKSIGAVNSYTFEDIDRDHTIEVSFVKLSAPAAAPAEPSAPESSTAPEAPEAPEVSEAPEASAPENSEAEEPSVPADTKPAERGSFPVVPVAVGAAAVVAISALLLFKKRTGAGE